MQARFPNQERLGIQHLMGYVLEGEEEVEPAPSDHNHDKKSCGIEIIVIRREVFIMRSPTQYIGLEYFTLNRPAVRLKIGAFGENKEPWDLLKTSHPDLDNCSGHVIVIFLPNK